MTEPVDEAIRDRASIQVEPGETSPLSASPDDQAGGQPGSGGDIQEHSEGPGGRTGADRRLDVDSLLESLRKERD